MGLLMAPTEKMTTAAHQEQTLFVRGEDAAVYSVRLKSSGSVPSVTRCTAAEPDSTALTVCGSSILGLLKASPRTVVVLDTVTLAAAPGPRLRYRKHSPVMLAVGDDTVVVMDEFLRRRRDCSSACCFEVLQRLPGGWRADPLPDVPVEGLWSVDDEELDEKEEGEYYGNYYYNPVNVSPYFVMGTRLWISATERGTFSLDLSSPGAWRVEGSWELPVLHYGRSFVEELGCAVGLVPSYDSSNRHKVCAIDVVEAQKERRPPVVRHVWEFPTQHLEVLPDEMLDLKYLGNGSFCLARCVIVDPLEGRGTSFTLLDLDGFEELARRRRDGAASAYQARRALRPRLAALELRRR